MNKFEQAALLERQKMEQIFKNKNITNYTFTDAKGFDKHDGTFVNTRGEIITFEVKVRNVNSGTYNTTVIEQSKYDYLLTQSNPHIFIFFQDGRYLLHRLDSNKNYIFSTKFAPKTTSGYNQKIDKKMVEIPIIERELYNL
jgi:hypothetical protein